MIEMLAARPQRGAGVVERLRAGLALGAFAVLTLALVPVQALCLRLPGAAKARIPVWHHRRVLAIIGGRVRVHGEIASGDAPLLLASNHCSWLDIPVLASLAPMSFIAKKEVAGWPFFGLLAKLQRTIFVDRENRAGVGGQADEMERRLAAGDALVLFAEGTSTDGNRVLPFKSSLFGVVEPSRRRRGEDNPLARAGAVRVQPVSVAYVASCGQPLGRLLRPRYAWYGAMDLPPHLWGALIAGPFEAVVRFHEPILADGSISRKEICARAERAVTDGLIAANRGCD